MQVKGGVHRGGNQKTGAGYKITVTNGTDINGKKIRTHMTWAPPDGMTPKQIEKELQRQAVLFEERVRHTATQDGNTRLVDFTERFLREYAYPTLKARTAFGYEEKMRLVNEALGHIKLKDLKPGHIASFYANLQEEGMRRSSWAVCKIDFAQWIRDHHTSMADLSRQSGLSIWVFKQCKTGGNIAVDSAKGVAGAMGESLDKVFAVQRDMTPLKPGTIHTYHRVLSAVLFRAVKWGYIKENPAARADLPSIANRKANYLDEDDARRLLELLHDEPIKWRTFFTFDLLSGLRRGELAGLRWRDVDFEAQTITVCQTSNYLPGRGVYADTPKSATSERPLRLSRSALLLLLDYKEWQDAQREKLGDAWEDQDGRIFTTDSGAPMFPDSISQWFTKFIKRTELPKVTVHSLRHTYASLMIADGVPLVVVSSNLGHAQVSTTSNIYSHVIKSAEAKAAQTFDKFNDLIVKEVPKEEPKKQKKATGE